MSKNVDLKALEYPRHLHKPAGAYLRVESPAEADAALKDGWTVDVPIEGESAPQPVAEPEPDPKKAPRKGKA